MPSKMKASEVNRYGVVAWGNATEKILKPLKSLLDRVVRIMTFAPFKINTGPILQFLKFLNVAEIFQFETGKFIFKLRNDMLPISTIAKYFVRGGVDHSHNLRNSNFHIIPLILLSSFKRRSVHIRGVDLWNDIPESLKSSISFNVFKRDFKLHILQGLNG